MRHCILMLIIVLALIACQPAQKSAPDSKVVVLADIALRYQPAQLATETPLELTVETPADWILVKAELVGISMDMLTMPLFFRRQAAENTAAAAGTLLLATERPLPPGSAAQANSGRTNSGQANSGRANSGRANSGQANSEQVSSGKPPTIAWHTQFLLGACADPQMRWRLELQFQDKQGTVHRRQDEFVVNRR